MEWMAIAELIKLVGGVVGAIVTIAGFVTVIMKKPKKWITNIAKEACKADIEEVAHKLAEHEETAKCERVEMGEDLKESIRAATEDRQQSFAKMTETLETMSEAINKKLEEGRQTNICTLRHDITSIYEEYKKEKKLPSYIKQDLIYLYDRYEKEGGNSYIKEIYRMMSEWETI